ncbi:MAG TPA: hypothetical protein VFY39_10775 [Gammaproteobacteria bacterium]|nr:hypothetical protein [Gammaproteobacteria bacterium]
MELFRVSSDVYGREVLQGIAWEWLWVFLGAGLGVVIVHALYRALFAPKRAAAPRAAVR